jgi:hypothetical protein
MKIKDLMDSGLSFGIAILVFALFLALSWIVTCGVIKLITLCFDWTYTWRVATGTWLVLQLLSTYFKATLKIDKN